MDAPSQKAAPSAAQGIQHVSEGETLLSALFNLIDEAHTQYQDVTRMHEIFSQGGIENPDENTIDAMIESQLSLLKTIELVKDAWERLKMEHSALWSEMEQGVIFYVSYMELDELFQKKFRGESSVAQGLQPVSEEQTLLSVLFNRIDHAHTQYQDYKRLVQIPPQGETDDPTEKTIVAMIELLMVKKRLVEIAEERLEMRHSALWRSVKPAVRFYMWYLKVDGLFQKSLLIFLSSAT